MLLSSMMSEMVHGPVRIQVQQTTMH